VKYFVTIGERTHEVRLVERLGELSIEVDGAPFELSYEEADRLGQVVLLHHGQSYGVSIEGGESEVGVTLAGNFYAATIEDERERAAHLAERAAARGGGVVRSVMPGIVVEVLVAPGDAVEEGQPLLILEAMKMQNEIVAPAAGRVAAVHIAAGQAVSGGERLVALEE